jgi:hypothetical protein
MNARILSSVGVIAALVVGGCKSDPTNSLVGTPSRVGFQFATLRVTVADSVPTFAVLQDEGSNPLVQAITITACDPTTVAVSGVASGAPLVQTNFFVKGVKFGTACVVATADGLTDTMQVATVPDHIAVTTGPDTVLSGAVGVYGYSYFDKQSHVMAGVPAPTWSSTTAGFGSFASSATPSYTAAAPGINTITATFSVSALGGTVTQTVTGTKVVATIPGLFHPALSAVSVGAGVAIVAVDPQLAGWKAASALTVGGSPTFVAKASGDSVTFIMPPFGDTKNRQILFTSLGAANLALGTDGTDSVHNSTSSLAGPYAPGDSSAATTVFITLPKVHGDTTVLYDTNHGACVNGGSLVGGTDTPGDHCNSLFEVFNNTAGPDTINAQVDWVWPAALGVDNPTTKNGGPDQDMYACDSTCSNFVGNFNAATTNTPETTVFIIPANTKWFILVNLFNPTGQPAILFKLTLNHK